MQNISNLVRIAREMSDEHERVEASHIRGEHRREILHFSPSIEQSKNELASVSARLSQESEKQDVPPPVTFYAGGTQPMTVEME